MLSHRAEFLHWTTTDTMADSNSKRLSLDEVFLKKAPAKAPGKRKLRLTPLSKKACLVHGIDPSVLQEKEYASFAVCGMDPEIQTMKYEMYHRTRETLYAVAVDERSKLAAKANCANDSFSTTDSVSTVSRTSMATSIDRKEQEVSTLIENEKRRLTKVQNRQQKELMRMLAFETKSKEIMAKMNAKTEEQARKEERRKKEARKRDLQAAEEARLRELRRKAKEDAEDSLQRLKMQEQFEHDRKIREKKQRDEKEKKQRAIVEEKQRIKKREAHRLHSQKAAARQLEETERKKKEREVKERERDAKNELKRLVDAQAAEVKRRETAKKIETNQMAARHRQEEKRSEFLQKQARHAEFMGEVAREQRASLAERQQRSEALNRKRKYQLKKTKEKEETTKHEMLSRIEQEDARLQELADQRRKEQSLLKAEKDLQLQMKKENLERIKKAQEYHLKEMMRKCRESDQRCNELKKRKEDLMKLRRKNAHEAKVKKDRLMAVLEQSKNAPNASGIKKLLKSVSTNEGQTKPMAKDDESLGPPPSFSRKYGDNEHVTDDFLGIGQISIHVDD